MSTDHRVVADSHLSRAAECVIELPLGSPDQMAYLATAQVHATLYAAEQSAALAQEQELANRIAYAAWCRSMGYITEQPVIETIRKGLGL